MLSKEDHSRGQMSVNLNGGGDEELMRAKITGLEVEVDSRKRSHQVSLNIQDVEVKEMFIGNHR